MTKQSVEDVALTQIPNLHCAVSRRAEQVATIRVEGDFVEGGLETALLLTFFLLFHEILTSVVLNESLRANIPNFDGLVVGAGGHTCAIGVEAHTVDSGLVIVKAKEHPFLWHVEDVDVLVGGTRSNQSGVG